MKKCSMILVMVMMLTFGFGSTVFSADDSAALTTDNSSVLATDNSTAKVVLMVERTNAVIEKMIEVAIQRGDALQVRYLQDMNKLIKNLDQLENSEAIIDRLDDKLDSDLNRIIENLIKTTDNKASGLVRYAVKKGAIVENDYILVIIGDKAVLVDPCRVRGD